MDGPAHHRPVRKVVVVAFEGVQSLDVAGRVEVFTRGGQLGGEPYDVQVVAAATGTVRTSSGIALGIDRSLAQVRGPVDTLVVAGGDGTADALRDERVLD